VRSQPINNEKFNFKVSIGQFLIGVIITPIIVDIYTSSSSESHGSTWYNIGKYLGDGFRCVTSFDENNKEKEIQGCSYSLFYIIGYTFSTFLTQVVLKALLERRRFSLIKKVFASAIVITISAFSLGYVAIPQDSYYDRIVPLDFACVILSMIGVFMYNWYEEKPVKISIAQ
jgi:hypothetical protein